MRRRSHHDRLESISHATRQQHMGNSPISSIQKSDGQAKPVISSETLKRLYTGMVQLRGFRANRNERTPSFSEASEAAAVAALQPGDAIAVFPGQRVGMLKGSAPTSTMPNRDRSTGIYCVLADGGNDRLAIATGMAFMNQIQHLNKVVLAFAKFGDIARTGDSLRFAHQRNLGIVYFEPTAAEIRQKKPTLHRLPTIPVDDNDAVAVYRVACESIEKARRGAGPTLIQCIRHGSRSAKGGAKDERADPVVYLEQYLRKRNLWSDDLRS